MAGVLLGASSSVPDYFTGGSQSKSKSTIASFEKELGYLVASLRKANKNLISSDHSGYEEFVQKTSNSMFNLWSSFEAKLPTDYFTRQQLALGDLLYKSGHYDLARTHCYGRFLSTHCVKEMHLHDRVADTKDSESTVALLRAMIGDAMCLYYNVEKRDPKMMYVSTRHTVSTILSQLQRVSQAALLREPLYWLAYNSVLFIYSISRTLMTHGYSDTVLEYLLWSAVCMESSVPLMASKYLRVRVNFYIAVCQCYFDLNQPQQAELFARRGLNKVHELAELEDSSSSVPTEQSELIYREASLKLGVIVFKRSVFLSRKKLKPTFRTKVRPTIKELLQLPSPRSPTEKLLFEMFTGLSAQLLAVLESLSDSSRRPLYKGPPPQPVGTELDQDSITDVYQELFCVGTDLAVQALEGISMFQSSNDSVDLQPSPSLISSAVKSGRVIPLENVVLFVRLAYSCEQKEIVEMLAERVVMETQVSESPHVRSKGKTLELLLMIDSLMVVFKKYKSTLTAVPQTGAPVPPNTATTTTSTGAGLPPSLSEIKAECNTTAEELFSKLQQTLSLLHLMVTDHTLLAADFDLLLDSTVFVWEVARPAFSTINSHDYASCRQFLGHPSGNQYLVFLAQLVEVFHSLELWRVDPLVHGELSLKLASLYEAKAQLKNRSNSQSCTLVKLTAKEGDFVLLYNRSQLLECLSELERDVKCIEQSRDELRWECEVAEGVTELEVLHSELVCAVTRVRLKLASTIPPPSPTEGTQKLSSLKSKVAERKERRSQRDRMLSDLTAPTVAVPDVAKLREECRQSHYKTALLLMLQASDDSQLSQTTKESLMEESYSHLIKETRRSNPALTNPPNTLPPPVLLYSSDTSLTFRPCPFVESPLQDQVSYYKLFGRVASGSNVKVRLSDKHLPGLGIEVQASTGDCMLTAHGLQTNEEYVFAVGAYSSSGQLVGGSVGHTSRPILSSYTLPLLTAWGYFCKCAYVAGAHTLAEKASVFLWKEFVLATDKPDQSSEDPYKLNHQTITSTPHSILRQFVQSIFIHTQLTISKSALFSDRLCREGPLKPSQLQRISLAKRLIVAIEVSAMLNDSSLCVQVVVMCYGVLAPLMQHGIAFRPVIKMLLHCYSVLVEVPESLVSNKHSNAVNGLHHMIAVMGYYLGKIALDENKKGLFSLLTDNARSLLVATMPPKQDQIQHTTSDGLHQSSLLSGSHDPSQSSYATISSGLPSLFPQGGHGKKKKLRSKKLMASTDDVNDESKSAVFKAFEGFLLSNYTHMVSEDLDLTGQEDPMVLHAIIATQTSQTAYREVHKFRRRPQYLEFFVHLASSTLSKGHVERVMEWCREAFHWLTRRNELLLSSKGPSTQGPIKRDPKGGEGKSTLKPQAKKTPRTMSRVMSACGSSLDISQVKKQPIPRNVSRVTSACGSSMNLVPFKKLPKGTASLGASLNVPRHPRKAPTAALAKLSPTKLRKLQPIMSTKVLDLSLDVKITREDIEAKAVLVMITLLPGMWRKHKARKRLRSVCSLELPWRAQANLIQATCCLEMLEKRMGSQTDGGEVDIQEMTFDAVGVLIEGVIPVYAKSLAGQVAQAPKEKDQRLRKDLQPNPSTGSTPNLLPLALADIHQMMIHFKRAITLAHRGRNWILLQNASRSLLNSITRLLQSCSKLAPGEQRDSLLAAVYGEALYPLYAAANGLIDLLLHSGVGVSGTSLPVVSSLTFTSKLDDCDMVGLLLIKRLVFLTVHVLHVHRHWEKTVSIIIKFDDVTKHSWAEQLVPVLTSAQSKLATRVSRNRATITRDKLEPAAHLDPGPDGYNVYGKVGHSLGLASVPLDNENSLKRLENCQRSSLSHARRLLGGYLGSFRDDSSQNELSDVMTAYDKAIEEMVANGDTDLLAQAMNELGDVSLRISTKSSSQWWSEALCVLLQTRGPLNTWRTNLSVTLGTAGLWGCLLAAGITYKLARYEYSNELDLRLEYSLMSVSLYKTALSFSLPLPTSDKEFMTYQLPGECSVFPGVELFSDPSRCSPLQVVASLSWCCDELINRGHVVTALPALWLYGHMAQYVCRDIHHITRARLLRLQALIQLYRYEECMIALSDLLLGVGLPQISSGTDRHVGDTHLSFPGFFNHLPLTDPRNMKCVQSIVDKPLSPGLTELYGEDNVLRLSLARAQLYTALAQSLTPLHTTPVVSRTGEQSIESTRPPTSLAPSSTTPGPSVSTMQVGTSSLSQPRSATSSVAPPTVRRTRLHLQDIKHILLDSSERYLTPLCQNEVTKHPSVKIKGFLELARVALTYTHQRAAIQLSLSALRTMQGSEYEYDARLWLECHAMLARSLVGCRLEHSGESELLDCSVQCDNGVTQCEAMGDIQLTAEHYYIAALHSMSVEPRQLEAVTINCQKVLELLESLPDLSPHASLLRVQSSLLLADVSCVAGVTGLEGEMVEVFRGLTSMIKDQLVDESHTPDPNIYLPHRGLLASCNLRLAHALCLRMSDKDVDEALMVCEEGLALLKASSQSDPCLMAELLVHQGWLWSITDGQTGISCLLEASKAIADCGVDPRLAVSTYYMLAELSTTLTQQAPSLKQADNLSGSPSISASPDRKRSRAETSRGSSRGGSKTSQAREQSSKADKEVAKERGRLAYCAWCLIKLGVKTANNIESLKQFVSEVSNEETTRSLPQKVLNDLPDFAVLDLCRSDQLISLLACSLDVPPIEALLPSAQSVINANINLFKVAGYFSKLSGECSWQKSSLSLSDSNWQLHHHLLTPAIYPKARALLTFLTNHSQQFKSLKVPSPPLSTFPATQPVPPQTPTVETYLTAGETELTVVWTSPFFLGSNTLVGDDQIVGYFAMNSKAIRAQSASTNVMQGIETYVIKTTVKALGELYTLWEELAESAKAYVDMRATTRPVSRSPSKQKKSEKALKVPQEIVDSASEAVEKLRDTFSIKGNELPKVDLPSVCLVSKVLEPFSQSTVRGDVFYFFKTLFTT